MIVNFIYYYVTLSQVHFHLEFLGSYYCIVNKYRQLNNVTLFNQNDYFNFPFFYIKLFVYVNY